MRIFHIVSTEVWLNFHEKEFKASSLDTEGFIHCSFADQVDDVMKRYYDQEAEVTILEIDPRKLRSKLVVEPSTGGENYPHVYGTINVDAIVGTERRKKN
jgi:uncharacterized protein (DUF952 family)